MSADVVYLEVVSLRGTFRRAGFVFDTTAKVIECSAEQAARIRAENGKALKVRDAQPSDAPVEVTLASLDERIASLSKANADAAARIAELEEIAAKAHADADAARKGCDELAKQLADAREANVKLSADLEAATAPKPKTEPKPSK